MLRRVSVFDSVNLLFLTAVGLVTGLPFLYLIFGSLTKPSYYSLSGVSINPTHWTLRTYGYLLARGSPVRQGLTITLLVATSGTILSVVTTVALGYGLSTRELPGRRLLTILVFCTMLFVRGIVPYYLVVRALGLTDTLWSLILPVAVRAYYLFVAVKFCETLPEDILEAARLDGCTELGVFLRVVIPLSKPILVTLALFYAVDYWNEWFWPIIFLRDAEMFPLQLVLRNMLDSSRVSVWNMAAIIISSTPIILLVLALQRRFMGTLSFLGLEGGVTLR